MRLVGQYDIKQVCSALQGYFSFTENKERGEYIMRLYQLEFKILTKTHPKRLIISLIVKDSTIELLDIRE